MAAARLFLRRRLCAPSNALSTSAIAVGCRNGFSFVKKAFGQIEASNDVGHYGQGSETPAGVVGGC